jgi:large subunit ribosomal protein L22
MAVAVANEKFLRISATKVRRISNEIVGKNVLTAESYLTVMPNKGAFLLKKAIHSARTNFLRKNANVAETDIIVSKILVNEGPTMKRFHTIGRGRAQRILKRMCHIYVEV